MPKGTPFKPVERGPQLGAPPSLEFVALDRLEVDAAYQRATDGPHSRSIINGMVKSWNWSLCQPLVVARRPDGRLMILDGQHRHAGAVRRGDIAHLPCVVLPGIDMTGEARTFLDLNTKRQRLSQADIFNGMLAAGDEHAKKTAQLIEQTGWRVARSSATDSWKPGDLHCAPMLSRQVNIVGEAAVRGALETLRTAYPETVVTSSSQILQALIAIFRKGMKPADQAVLGATISSLDPPAWILRAENRRHREGRSISTLVAIVVVIEEAAGLRPAVKPAIAASNSVPAPTQPREEAFGVAGKGWCDQCEQLVDRGAAGACKSTFCKMKAAA
jgi:hypothetical protein